MSGLDGGVDGAGGVSVTPSHVGGASALLPSSSSSGGVIKGSPSQYVKLNVGGSLHYTTIGTLTKHDNMLRAMFSGRMEVLSDPEGEKQLKTNQSINQ